jgi:GntR family transcriptional regulator, trigonelline degradation regulator
MSDDALKITRVAAPLRQRVVENIRGAIEMGRFKPGERLVERELCGLLDVSRTAVREALRQLESEGLVENLPNRGPAVAVIRRDDAIAIYEARGALEALVGRLFAERASDKQISQVRASVEVLKKTYNAGDALRILKAKMDFYELIFEGARSPVAEGMLRTIYARANFLRAIALSRPNRWKAAMGEVKDILSAIEERKPDRVAKLFAHHVHEAMESALTVIDPSI